MVAHDTLCLWQFLGRITRTHLQSEVQDGGGNKVRLGVLSDDGHALVWVGERLDSGVHRVRKGQARHEFGRMLQ